MPIRSSRSDPLAGLQRPGGGVDQRAAAPERADWASRGDDRDNDPFGFGLAEAPLPESAPEPPKHPGGRSRQQPDAASDAAALLAAFLEGAGQDAAVVAGRNPEAFLRETGRVFARLANGVRELLAVRATVKDHAGLDRTQISAALNNPLKPPVNAREATAALLGGGGEGYLAPLAAVEASFRDLKAHELAILEGAQSAVEELLELFDPAELEQRLDDAGMLAVLVQGGRRARLWELYQESYGEIAGAARTRFMGRLDDAFRSAYARKSAEVSALADRAVAARDAAPVSGRRVLLSAVGFAGAAALPGCGKKPPPPPPPTILALKLTASADVNPDGAGAPEAAPGARARTFQPDRALAGHLLRRRGRSRQGPRPRTPGVRRRGAGAWADRLGGARDQAGNQVRRRRRRLFRHRERAVARLGADQAQHQERLHRRLRRRRRGPLRGRRRHDPLRPRRLVGGHAPPHPAPPAAGPLGRGPRPRLARTGCGTTAGASASWNSNRACSPRARSASGARAA